MSSALLPWMPASGNDDFIKTWGATMRGVERALQQIAFGHVVLPSGKTRGMYNYEMINLAREACDQLGIPYSNGTCKPYRPAAGASASFRLQDQAEMQVTQERRLRATCAQDQADRDAGDHALSVGTS